MVMRFAVQLVLVVTIVLATAIASVLRAAVAAAYGWCADAAMTMARRPAYAHDNMLPPLRGLQEPPGASVSTLNPR